MLVDYVPFRKQIRKKGNSKISNPTRPDIYMCVKVCECVAY